MFFTIIPRKIILFENLKKKIKLQKIFPLLVIHIDILYQFY